MVQEPQAYAVAFMDEGHPAYILLSDTYTECNHRHVQPKGEPVYDQCARPSLRSMEHPIFQRAI